VLHPQRMEFYRVLLSKSIQTKTFSFNCLSLYIIIQIPLDNLLVG